VGRTWIEPGTKWRTCSHLGAEVTEKSPISVCEGVLRPECGAFSTPGRPLALLSWWAVRRRLSASVLAPLQQLPPLLRRP
jgi:hypothetical protein